MMELVKTNLESSKLEEVTNSMFTAAGFEDKKELSLEDFLVLMTDHKEDFSEAALNLKGIVRVLLYCVDLSQIAFLEINKVKKLSCQNTVVELVNHFCDLGATGRYVRYNGLSPK